MSEARTQIVSAPWPGGALRVRGGVGNKDSRGSLCDARSNDSHLRGFTNQVELRAALDPEFVLLSIGVDGWSLSNVAVSNCDPQPDGIGNFLDGLFTES